jgi:hypothetical protein
VVRGERPEVTAAVADVLGAAATALRSFSEAGRGATPEDPGAPTETMTGPGAASPPGTTSPVQRVEIA